jgi:mannosyltransferase OCH1-like enzyme
LWDQSQIETLITEKYPFLLDVYNSYPFFIQKVDLAKYVILYEYGGFYFDVDLDIDKDFFNTISTYINVPKYIKITASSFQNDEKVSMCVFARSPTLDLPFISKIFSFLPWTNVVNNNFLYFPRPNHPLCEMLVKNLHEYSCRYPWELKAEYIFRSTGPIYLMNIIRKYLDRDKIYDITYIEPNNIFTDIAENSWNKVPLDKHDFIFIIMFLALIILTYIALRYKT